MDEPAEQLHLFGPPQLSALAPPAWLDLRLERLERLLELGRVHDGHLNGGGRRLLHRAIFATYVECREMGGSAAARALLSRYGVGSDAAETVAIPTEENLAAAAGE